MREEVKGRERERNRQLGRGERMGQTKEKEGEKGRESGGRGRRWRNTKGKDGERERERG